MKNTTPPNPATYHIALIGTAGVPNCYGGFESFVEFCGPVIAHQVKSVTVTCDASLYSDQQPQFQGMNRIFLPIRANGAMSVIHDLFAFFAVFRKSTHIIVLGVSGGGWFPVFRLLCDLFGKQLLVNVDGVEWRRTKFSRSKRLLLRCFDALAQLCAHVVIYDNAALRDYLWRFALLKSVQIGYSGDHAKRLPEEQRKKEPGTALTICRIEPENNIELMIEGALRSKLHKYTIVGNWSHSSYGTQLKDRYLNNERLELLDSIYDLQRLTELREKCDSYLHGHSVGGTNPSLIEMLFYDCKIFCFDVTFHHETAGSCARYFRDANELAVLLDTSPDADLAERKIRRTLYSSQQIALQYISAMK
jgi:glycosyltransferase involved in cell wall biosynthesis